MLLDLDLEVGLLAGEGRLGVVVGEGDVEFGRVADLETEQVVLEAGDEPVIADDRGIRSEEPPSNGSPSRVPSKPITT